MLGIATLQFHIDTFVSEAKYTGLSLHLWMYKSMATFFLKKDIICSAYACLHMIECTNILLYYIMGVELPDRLQSMEMNEPRASLVLGILSL